MKGWVTDLHNKACRPCIALRPGIMAMSWITLGRIGGHKMKQQPHQVIKIIAWDDLCDCDELRTGWKWAPEEPNLHYVEQGTV